MREKAKKFIPPLPRDVKENYIYGYSSSSERGKERFEGHVLK
jgi:hypothetical protein